MFVTSKNFYKKFLGRSGENKAVRYLKCKGFKILERNYISTVGEIDVIAKYKNFYVFIEVKTRMSSKYGSPAEAVTPFKQNKYRIMAAQYLSVKDLSDVPMRFDVIEILDGAVNHIENAF